MKALIIAALLTLSTASFADITLQSEKADSQLSILDLVVGVKQAYSKASELDAKVISLLAGDGMNPTRMALVVSTGLGDSKVFELEEKVVDVKRITFLAKDLIVINFSHDTFDADDEQIVVNKSITIKVQRNADNTLADTIKIIE